MPAEHTPQPTNPHRDGKCAATWDGHVCVLAAAHKGAHHACFCSRRFFKRHQYKPANAAGCKVCGQPLLHDWHTKAAA